MREETSTNKMCINGEAFSLKSIAFHLKLDSGQGRLEKLCLCKKAFNLILAH